MPTTIVAVIEMVLICSDRDCLQTFVTMVEMWSVVAVECLNTVVHDDDDRRGDEMRHALS